MADHNLLSREQILARFDHQIYPHSLSISENKAYFIIRTPVGKRLGILMPAGSEDNVLFSGTLRQDIGKDGSLLLCLLDVQNFKALLKVFPSLKPVPLGLETSAGFGDRLGLATPGHVMALNTILSRSPGCKILPIFAQQSVRENNRTGRTPEQVLSDATWGAFQEGWHDQVGADADHLKKEADIDVFVEASYSLFTIDPGEHVDSSADTAQGSDLMLKVEALPWAELETSLSSLRMNYSGKQIDVDGRWVAMSEEDLMRAAAKYGRAVAHTAKLYRYLVAKGIPFELEVSVDETDTPTRIQEHFYVASELKRLGVRWVSIAPRFVGRFEKGVDYIGNLQALEKDLEGHAALARLMGPYKLSLHSGSDKFSVYPLAVKACGGLVHLKTAGTSYLEALRVLAMTNPVFFRKILVMARDRYETDRKTYHVSARLDRVPVSDEITDTELPGLLEQFDARQVFHVTFGSILDSFGGSLLTGLLEREDVYYQLLEKHFVRHLRPFVPES